jgi:hypothetical protein
MNSLRTVPQGRSTLRMNGVLFASCRSLHARDDIVDARLIRLEMLTGDLG